MRQLPDLSLYLVLDPKLCAPLGMIETARQAAHAGAGVIQLRDKTGDTAERIALGHALMQAIAGTPAILIVNDDVEAARAIQAHGVHVGQDDMPAAKVRAWIGPDMLLGVSVSTAAHAAAIDPKTTDYAGVGPVFATPTKTDHKAPLGFDGLAERIAQTPLPSVAIGGLKPTHAAAAIAAGAQGLAVVSAICGTPDPAAATAEFAQAIAAAKGANR